MERKHRKLTRGKDWYLFTEWSNVETHVMRGHSVVAEAPGQSMTPTQAAKLMVRLKKEGWKG